MAGRFRNSAPQVFSLRQGGVGCLIHQCVVPCVVLCASEPYLLPPNQILPMMLRQIAPIVAASFLAAGMASAQTAVSEMKIGIVDMKRVFQEYYKTKDAEKKVNDDKSKAKKELDDRSAKYRDLITKWNDSQKILQDKLVNEELKQQKAKEAQGIATEAKALEREIDEFRRRREAQLQEQVMRMRKNLLEDIRQRVEEKAKRDNYDLVFDKSGMSPSGVPFLLHSKDAVDFSTDVLTELNKGAPAGAAAAPATKGGALDLDAPAGDAKK